MRKFSFTKIHFGLFFAVFFMTASLAVANQGGQVCRGGEEFCEGEDVLGTQQQMPTAAPVANQGRMVCRGGEEFCDGEDVLGTQPTAPSTSGSGASAEASESLTEKCASAASTAKGACLFPGVTGMQPGESAMYTMMTNQLVGMASQIASIGKNMSAQCKLQADIAKIMTAINGVKGSACAVMINSCTNACQREEERADYDMKNYQANNLDSRAQEERLARGKARRAAEACQGYKTEVAAMGMGAMQSLGNFMQNKQCQSDLAAMAAAPAFTPIAMPTIGDCSDPNNQSMTCFCQKEANAQSPMCNGFNPGALAGAGAATTPNGGGSTASPYASTAGDGLGDGNTADPFGNAARKGGGDGRGPGDGGSGAPGGGGLSSLSSEGGGGGGGGDPKSAITGTSGSQGGGLGSAGGGGGAGGLARNNGAGAAGKAGFFDKFNLKKFLPKSKYKTRGIAGMSVKSVDGITGPMGPSIWEKATRQYQEQIQKQNVILEK